MTRTKPAEQRRADLLAAGQALFLAKGIAATSLEDITHRAGVSKGLFYLYFHSKEDLVLALQEQFSQQVAERVAAAANIPADWTARLDACVQASFECYRDLHDLHEILFHHAAHPSSPPQPSPPHQPGSPPQAAHPGSPHQGGPAHPRLAQVIRDLLAAGTAAGAFDVADPEMTAALCYATMHAFDGPCGPDDARLLRAARQLFRRAAGVAASVAGG